MAGNPTHGREGALYLSTTTGSTELGTEIGFTNSWSWSPSKDVSEITALNQSSKYYIEGLISGTVSAEGSLLTGSSMLRTIIGRYAKVMNDTDGTMTSTDAAAITDGNFYLHLIAKPIDTGGSSDDVRGQKFMVPVIASGLSVDASGADIVGWSYEGQQNGDAYYVESTDSALGIPTKAV